MSSFDLFGANTDTLGPERIALGRHAYVLRGFALPWVNNILQAITQIEGAAPMRHMVTPGGFTMSVALTNCGALGWTSDRRGYRYASHDPVSHEPWPAMPAAFSDLAREAAAAAGFADFKPDACLINRYAPASKMSLHQDKNERDIDAPIVSVSLGMRATFLFGGFARSDKTYKIDLYHGDVAVWGGEDRLRFHGILPLKGEAHTVLGEQRINLTLRRAG